MFCVYVCVCGHAVEDGEVCKQFTQLGACVMNLDLIKKLIPLKGSLIIFV